MGAVYLARETAAERDVAMKFLHHPGRTGALDRFLVELRAFARLDHPNVVRVFASDFFRSDPYFTMEYVGGGTLAKRLETGGPFAPAEAARLIATVARAVHAAHAAGVVHRDLKPSNILLTEAGAPKVADFGLAKRTDRDDRLTTGSGPLGTPGYMAPEQVRGAPGSIGPAADVYGLGATLYHLLTGRPPFSGSQPDVFNDILCDPPARPRALRRAVPRALEAVCLKCLEKDPDRRYPTAEALAIDLDQVLAGGRPVAPELTWRRRAARSLARHRRGLAWAAAAALAAVVVFVLGAAMTPDAPNPEPPARV
jgi:serine/threonine protein kinase